MAKNPKPLRQWQRRGQMETRYLLRSGKNSQRLMASVAQLKLSATEQERLIAGLLNPSPATDEVIRAFALHRLLVK